MSVSMLESSEASWISKNNACTCMMPSAEMCHVKIWGKFWRVLTDGRLLDNDISITEHAL